MLNAMRRRAERRRSAQSLLARLAERARLAVFYERFRVADTIDGRFDLLVLHAWLVLESLFARKETELAQSLVDGLFIHFEEALREQGAGDIGMGRRMSKMADAFYGRMKAYSGAGDRAALSAAILRNVYRGDDSKLDHAAALVIYTEIARRHLAASDLAQGEPEFGPVP